MGDEGRVVHACVVADGHLGVGGTGEEGGAEGGEIVIGHKSYRRVFIGQGTVSPMGWRGQGRGKSVR